MNIWVILFIVTSVISLAIPFIKVPDRDASSSEEVKERSGARNIRTILLNLEQLDLDLATGKLAQDDHGHLKTRFLQELAEADPKGVWESGEEDGALS